MLVKLENGEFYDTHESFNNEREEEIYSIGDQIIEQFEEEYVDGVNCIVEFDDYRKWVNIDDTPNYKELLEQTIQEYITDKMDEDFINDLREYIDCNVSSEDNLCDRAIEHYQDSYFDEYGD